MKEFPVGEWLPYCPGTSREPGVDGGQDAGGQASMLSVEGLQRESRRKDAGPGMRVTSEKLIGWVGGRRVRGLGLG